MKPEVLAPAGDLTALKAAVRFGADACYLGGQMFGMRAAPQNFDEKTLQQGVAFAHERGAKVYVTCNTLPRNFEIAGLSPFLHQVAQAGVDALIVADLGVLQLVRRELPDMEVHASTQTGVVNYLTANALFSLGVKRVVLARELSLEEIREIREKCDPALELECFVHGAMCMSVSGRCLLSNYLTGRDANRGACAQPCRWKYALMEEKRPGAYFPIEEEGGYTHILNAQDLCMIGHLKELQEAGVSSFKIEGRAKTDFYVATVTNAYRLAVDALQEHPDQPIPAYLLEEVEKVSHRAYSTGFYFGEPGQSYENGGYLREYEVTAQVTGWENGRAQAVLKNRVQAGSEVELLCPHRPPLLLSISDLRDEEGKALSEAIHPMMRFTFACETPVPEGSFVRARRQEAEAAGGR